MNITPTSVSRICPRCRAPFPYKDAHRCAGSPSPEPSVVVIEDPLIGAVLADRYEIEGFLQEGGMGAVYKARHRILGHRLAVKVLRTTPDQAAQQRFMLEAQAACSIGHVNIVQIVDFGVLPDRRPYLAMEFLQGQSLHELVSSAGLAGLAAQRACRIGEQIALGMQAVHDKGIIHRDLKPGNIFILDMDGKDFVKILDFGIAKVMSDDNPAMPEFRRAPKLTQEGMVMGTPEYMAPERAVGQPPDQREDQYALGCILYEMLTGTIPFDVPGNPMAIVMQHITMAPEPPRARRPDLPASLEQLVLRCLAKDPGGRYGSMRELAQDLQREAEALIARHERSGSASPPVLAPSAPDLSAVRGVQQPATAPTALDRDRPGAQARPNPAEQTVATPVVAQEGAATPAQTHVIWVPGQPGGSLTEQQRRRWLPAVAAGVAGCGLLLVGLSRWPQRPAPADQQRPAPALSAQPGAVARPPAERVRPPAQAPARPPVEPVQLPADQARRQDPPRPFKLVLESGNGVEVTVSCSGQGQAAIAPKGRYRVSIPPGKKGACELSAKGYERRTLSFDALRGGQRGGAVPFRLEPL